MDGSVDVLSGLRFRRRNQRLKRGHFVGDVFVSILIEGMSNEQHHQGRFDLREVAGITNLFLTRVIDSEVILEEGSVF